MKAERAEGMGREVHDVLKTKLFKSRTSPEPTVKETGKDGRKMKNASENSRLCLQIKGGVCCGGRSTSLN